MGKLRELTMALGIFVSIASWVPTASAAGASIDSATTDQKNRAQKLFVDAKKEYDNKNFDKALEGFRQSYDVVASPNTLLMVARTLRELDRVVESYLAFQEAIAEAKKAAEKHAKYGQAAEAAEKELDEIRSRVGFVVIRVTGGTEDTRITINDQPIERDKWGTEIPVRVGVITLVATANGKPEHRQDVTVAGGTTTHELDLSKIWAPPAPPAPKPVVVEPKEEKSVDLLGLDKRTWAYIAGGVGAAGVVTFGVFGSMARSNYNSLDSDCPNGVCPTDRSDDIDAGKRNQTIANVGLVVGVVGLGTGTALYLMSSDKKGRETEVGLGPGSVTVRGTF